MGLKVRKVLENDCWAWIGTTSHLDMLPDLAPGHHLDELVVFPSRGRLGPKVEVGPNRFGGDPGQVL